MKRLLTFILLSLFITNNGQAYTTQTDSLLQRLDRTIANKQTYATAKEKRIELVKDKLKEASNLDDKISITKDICLEYIVCNADSAFSYVTILKDYVKQISDYEKYVDSELFQIRILTSMGSLKESSEMLDRIDTLRISGNLKTFYLYTKLSVYNSLRDFSGNDSDRKKYEDSAIKLRERLLSEGNLSPMDYIFVNAEHKIVNEKYDEALTELLDVYNTLDSEKREAGIIAYSIAVIYERKGDQDKAVEYFARSAIADLINGVREYASLRRLATMMFENEDINRAYNYMKCSMEDAIACNAKLRTLESSEMFLIIDQSYQKKEEQRKQLLTTFLIVSTVLLTFIAVVLVYTYQQKNKLAKTKDELSKSNHLLKETNKNLSDSNIIKEEYIGQYISQFSDYLSKIERYKSKAQKIVKTQGVDALMHFIESSLDPKDNLEEFYKDFDKIILRLFPDFVEQVSQLLVDGESLKTKSNDSLTSELRILALIRLGITDSIKIAYFLRYSSSTVYNYRTKMRNRAKGNRDEFEDKVMKIGLE